jgi:hypothetical protein
VSQTWRSAAPVAGVAGTSVDVMTDFVNEHLVELIGRCCPTGWKRRG